MNACYGRKWMSVTNVRKRTSVRNLHLTSVNSYYLRQRLQSWHIPYAPTISNYIKQLFNFLVLGCGVVAYIVVGYSGHPHCRGYSFSCVLEISAHAVWVSEYTV